MIKCRIHISGEKSMDDKLFVIVNLPAVPRKGEWLRLTNDVLLELENKAKSDLVIAQDYMKYFYSKSFHKDWFEVKKEHLQDLSFEEAINVAWIEYTANSEYVDIELDKDI